MRCLHCLSWITALPRGSPPLHVLLCVPFGYSKHSLVGLTICLELVTVIWWLMQQISKYSHNAFVFEELLAMETQGHLRGDEWGG